MKSSRALRILIPNTAITRNVTGPMKADAKPELNFPNAIKRTEFTGSLNAYIKLMYVVLNFVI